MQKNKIMIIGPISPQPANSSSIINTLSFLEESHTLDYLDPLSIMRPFSNQAYYQLWKEQLATSIQHYDAFLGFSFGGIILQQCFSLFSGCYKPIILFSTPTFADDSLTKKLGQVIHLCQENRLDEALNTLYQPVFYPKTIQPISSEGMNKIQACERLIFGLDRVLATDSREILNKNTVPHIHLIGEYSHLVNNHNVTVPHQGHLFIVPEAGMRVVEDNPLFCQKIILEALNDEAI